MSMDQPDDNSETKVGGLSFHMEHTKRIVPHVVYSTIE